MHFDTRWLGLRSVFAVVDLLLLIFLFYVPHIICGESVLVFVLLSNTLCHFLFCNHLDEVEREVYFILIVFLVSCVC